MTVIGGSGLAWVAALTIAVFYRFMLRTPHILKDGIPLRKPPNTLPVVGNGLVFLQARQKLFSWFVKCEREFGYETFQISVPTLYPGVVINDPKNLEYVFKNEGIFAKGDFVKQRSWDLFGHGIINVDGDLWRVQRKAGLHFLSAVNLRVLTNVALPPYLNDGIQTLRIRARQHREVDLQSVFHEITSQLMGKMAYNMAMHAEDEFTKAFDYASGITAERFQNPLWFITEKFTGGKFTKALETIRHQGAVIVENAVSGRSPERDDEIYAGEGDRRRLDRVSGSLIQSLLDALGSRRDIVADAALNYLSAGRDTVAQALTWSMYLLVQHREAAEKIRVEVEKRLEAYPAAFSDPDGIDLSEEQISTIFSPTSLSYTMAVFYEALRLYPPIPFEIKECEKSTTLPDGTFLPERSVVLWCPWAMNRSRITWGEDADSFRPERWLVLESDGSRRLVTRSASEFSVFNGGPRTCLGKRMAELIGVQVIATMTLLFDFTPAYASERVSKSSLTLPMEGGLPCFVKIRSSAKLDLWDYSK